MKSYLYCDISIESEIELPGLSTLDDEDPDLFFRVDLSSRSLVVDSSWKKADLGEGNIVSSAILPGTDRYCLIFENLAKFEIRNGFRDITCFPGSATALNTIHHLLLDQVLPRVLSARRKLMMHGSCIEHQMGVIVFAGVSGAGKSTLAAHFSRRGFPLLSDDGLQLKQDAGKITIIPTYPGLRLWGDSFTELFDATALIKPMAHYSSKKRIVSETVEHMVERPALSIFILRPQPPGILPSIARIVKREAFFEINKQVFILDPFSREKAVARINDIAELISRLPVFKLCIPHDYSMLDQVQKFVLDLVETLKS
jgi:hypothetical protein